MKQTSILMIWILCFLIFALTNPLAADEIAAAEKVPVKQIEEMLQKELKIFEALQYAYIKNPEIKSARESWKSMIEDFRIITGYPDPQLMVTYFPSPIETRLGPQDWNLNLSQTIPFPGKLTQKGKIIESKVRASKLKLDKTVKKVTTDIIISYQEIYYIQQAIAIAKANYNLGLELLKIGETAYADNQSNFYDISKAQTQVAQIQYDILLLEELAQSEKVKINSLLNRMPDKKIGAVGELKHRNVSYSLQEIYSLFLTHQEDILIAREKIIESDEQVVLSKFDTLPSFKLGLFYAGIGDPNVAKPPSNAGDDAIGIQFGFNIPIWSGKNNGRTEKALAGKRKAISDKIRLANMGKTKISRAWFKLKNSERLIVLYKNTLLPQSLKSVQTAETWFRQGEGSFSDFLEVQATAYNFKLSLERAKADYNQTLAQLELLVGIPLDVKIDVKTSADEGGAS